jgi:MATE family multidrug resistance protein
MSSYIKEIRATMVLGVPLILAQLSNMAMALTDAIVVGRGVGTDALAAMSFALSYMNMPCVALYGFSSATSVLVATSFGAGRKNELTDILRHGALLSFYAALLVTGLMLVGFRFLGHVNYLGQPPHLMPVAWTYLPWYAGAFVCQLTAGNFRAFCESQNKPWLPLYVVLGSIGMNAFLDVVLVYGCFGLPKLGLTGAGFATFLCALLQLVILYYLVNRNGGLHFSRAQFWRLRLAGSFLKNHLRIGLPTMIQIGLEVSALCAVGLMAGLMGATVMAANHIAMQVAFFAFMVPLGMSFAVSIRCAQAAGANDRAQVRSVARSSLAFAACWMACTCILTVLLRNELPHVFTKDEAVIPLVSSFLVVAGLFQIFDGIQATAMGALRGMKDVNLPTFLTLGCSWFVCVPLAWFLSLYLGWGGIGIWIAFATALALSATFLTLRLSWYLKKGPMA